MVVAQTIAEMRSFSRKLKNESKTRGFVPTMGALHDGHLSLVEIAKRQCDSVIMSIFINRLQFNDSNDYGSYPKTVEADLKKAQDAGVACVFLPTEETMYDNHRSYVEVSELTKHLCGATRPGHFQGVFTVVTKLFNIVQPDKAFFGQKDIQQARSIEKMVYDLNMPLEIVIAPIIRESSGLAMSSRNIHLSPEEKNRALSLYKALNHADSIIQGGERDSQIIQTQMRSIIENEGKPDKIDYISIVNYETLQPVDSIAGKCVLALGAFFGSTRLIDNRIIEM